MQINVSARQVELTPPIEEYVRSKCERILRYFDRIQAIEVAAHVVSAASAFAPSSAKASTKAPYLQRDRNAAWPTMD